MNLRAIESKSIAMIVWNTAKEDDVHIYLGKLQNANGKYSFINKEKGWNVSLDEEQLSRLQPVSEDMREVLLNADYAFSMTMANLPDTEDKSHLNNTDINWNQ